MAAPKFSSWNIALASALAAASLAQPSLAQGRDPAYAAARAAGEVGERIDGYLGVVGSNPALHRLVEDINIKRKAFYAEKAQGQHATVEDYAFATGCGLIAKTTPGEKYQAPDGSWHSRGDGPLLRDPRCP